MRPKTPEAMYSLLIRAFWTRLYGDLSAAAQRTRLTERDIAGIERRVLEVTAKAAEAADEFSEFDARRVVEGVMTEAREGLRVIREARAQQIAKEH